MNVRWEDRELRRKVRRVMEFGVIRQGTTGTKTVYDTAMTFI